LDVAASMMVMAGRRRVFGGPIGVRVERFCSHHMNMSCVVVVTRVNEGGGWKISGVADSVL